MPLDPYELNLAKVVAEDLAYLMDEWKPSFKEDAIRRQTPILRRLLVEGLYARAWRSLGLPGEPYVSAPTLEAMIGSIDPKFIRVAFSPPGPAVASFISSRSGQVEIGIPEGGAIEAGTTVALIPGYQQGLGPILAAIPSAVADPLGDAAVATLVGERVGSRQTRGMPLTAFLRSIAVSLPSDQISRQEVLTFVANKLGGVHFDSSRERKSHARVGKYLDARLITIRMDGISDLNFGFIEVQSIIEFLVESGDTARYRDEFGRSQRETQGEATIL